MPAIKKYKNLIKYLQTVDQVWLAIWTIIYIGFLTVDACLPGFFGATILKYSGIALCFVYAFTKYRADSLMIIALGFTLLADTILVVDSTSIIGVFVFCFAQFFHLARLRQTSPKFLLVYAALVLIVFFTGIMLHIVPMYILAPIYCGTLITNLVLAGKWYFKERSVASGCAFCGFILFVCCDACVAISYLSYTTVISTTLYPIANYMAWVFYYPSQILVSNSSKLHSKKPNKILSSKQSVIK